MLIVLRVLSPLFLLWLLITTGVTAQTPARTITIAGDDLPFEIDVAAPDADNFGRRLGQLPRREDFEGASGRSYTITSDYWSVAVPLEDEEEELGAAPGESAAYFPDSGFVRVDIGGSNAWVVLNLRQRAILDRYINLAKAELIPSRPSTIEVLTGAFNAGETIGVNAGADLVDPALAARLFSMLSTANPTPKLQDPSPPVVGNEGFWIIVTLLEGRDLRYYYDGQSLTESLGTERYDATDVSDLLGEMAPLSMPQIEQEAPAGSLIWWPLMIGGGLVALGAAVWLRRRTAG